MDAWMIQLSFVCATWLFYWSPAALQALSFLLAAGLGSFGDYKIIASQEHKPQGCGVWDGVWYLLGQTQVTYECALRYCLLEFCPFLMLLQFEFINWFELKKSRANIYRKYKTLCLFLRFFVLSQKPRHLEVKRKMKKLTVFFRIVET